jgi:hypothetical protein
MPAVIRRGWWLDFAKLLTKLEKPTRKGRFGSRKMRRFDVGSLVADAQRVVHLLGVALGFCLIAVL